MDELKDLNTSIICRLDQRSLLLLVEVCGDCDDSRVDLLSQEIRGRRCKTTEVTGGNLRNGDGRWFVFFFVLYREGNRGLVLLGVCRGVAVCGVYRLETVTEFSSIP